MLDIPYEIVETAESKLSAAENDLKSTIASTRSRAIENLGAAVGGNLYQPCVDLVTTWQNEVNQLTSTLAEFKASLVGTRNRIEEDSSAEAKLVSNIDVHAMRLG